MDDIAVGETGIRLGQLLKLTGLVESGGSVKALLARGSVEVNGRVEIRRGAQLKRGDQIRCGDRRIRLS